MISIIVCTMFICLICQYRYKYISAYDVMLIDHVLEQEADVTKQWKRKFHIIKKSLDVFYRTTITTNIESCLIKDPHIYLPIWWAWTIIYLYLSIDTLSGAHKGKPIRLQFVLYITDLFCFLFVVQFEGA